MSLLRFLFGARRMGEIGEIRRHRAEVTGWSAEALRDRFRQTEDITEGMAIVCETAARTLGFEMFDVQLRGALSMARGRIAEMQTGEGKTLACTPAVAWLARSGKGIHVLTVNDYLARRDAQWMGPIYAYLGLTVGCIQQTMGIEERRAAYRCDITYATANEAGFDFLRDQIALTTEEQVHRPFAAVLIDEADSILIDEARIPLVLAGGEAGEEVLARKVEPIVRRFVEGVDYSLDEERRNISLLPRGARWIENASRCGNIFAESNLALYTAVHNAIHAHALLRRDVDYVVKNGAIESVDEFKGRIAQDRRWPAGLQTAIEAKERVSFTPQGRVLGSITFQNLAALYPTICGMTGTAATESSEFKEFYGLEIDVIPTNRPMIRVDEPDAVYESKGVKQRALVEEIRRLHEAGQPVLVGTASVEESERLSRALDGVPHSVLNARNEEAEAEVIAHAGGRGAVTISTNMAGRGVDIKLGEGVAELGGLFVIGTNRHESRRIDHQLRGRAGRQGDPGRSRFFVSLEDDLVGGLAEEYKRLRYNSEEIQRAKEGRNLDIRIFLAKYEGVIEGERQRIQAQRQTVLESDVPPLERQVTLLTIDELWSDFLAGVTELRSGVQWYSWGGRDPLYEYLTRVDAMCKELEARIPVETADRLAKVQSGEMPAPRRGATWTYLTTDRPFGMLTERFARGLLQRMTGRR